MFVASFGCISALFSSKYGRGTEGKPWNDGWPERLAPDPERRCGAVCDRQAFARRQPVGGGAGGAGRDAAWRAARADAFSRQVGSGGAAQRADGVAAGGGGPGGLSAALALG